MILIYYTVPPDSDDIQRALFVRNAIAHGSTMYRKSAVLEVGGYSDKYGPTEDIDLWMKLMKLGDFAATASPLYKWRMNQSGLTLTNNQASTDQGQAHFKRRWQESRPKLLKRKEVMQKANTYLRNYGKRGVHYKHVFLNDTSQIASKLFINGYRADGIRQLIVVASTGRTGLKIAVERVFNVILGRVIKT